MEPKLPAKVEASFSIIPSRSQTFLVSVVLFAATLAVCSLLVQNDPVFRWVLLGFSAATFLLGGAGWWKSQPDVDSENSHPTSLRLPDGTTISSDSRTVRDLQSVQHIIQLLEASINRKPLPDADGLLDSDLKLIPGSKESAQAVTLQINNEVQADTNSLLDALNLSKDSTTVAPILLNTETDKT